MIKTKRAVNGLGFTAIVLLALTLLAMVGTQFVSTGAAQVSPSPSPTPKPSSTPTPSPSAAPIPGLILTNGYVSPTSGTNSTVFTYYVTYYDPNVMKPMAAYAVIDNAVHLMTVYTGSVSMGIYGYSTTLAPAAHTYYFMFTSGFGQTIWYGWPNQLSGPEVISPTPTPTPLPTPSPSPSLSPSPSPNPSPSPSPSPTPSPTASPSPHLHLLHHLRLPNQP